MAKSLLPAAFDLSLGLSPCVGDIMERQERSNDHLWLFEVSSICVLFPTLGHLS